MGIKWGEEALAKTLEAFCFSRLPSPRKLRMGLVWKPRVPLPPSLLSPEMGSRSPRRGIQAGFLVPSTGQDGGPRLSPLFSKNPWSRVSSSTGSVLWGRSQHFSCSSWPRLGRSLGEAGPPSIAGAQNFLHVTQWHLGCSFNAARIFLGVCVAVSVTGG